MNGAADLLFEIPPRRWHKGRNLVKFNGMQIKTEPTEFVDLLTDASNLPGGFAGKVFFPENENDLIEVLAAANADRVPVTISGGRTGTVGGAIPFGGWLVSLSRMDAITATDVETRRITVEPGVILGDLQKHVESAGLFYPPDPTEWSCQIGGTVATNASGARSFKYGATRRYVEGLRVVLANGETLRLKRGEIFSAGGEMQLVTEQGTSITVKLPSYPQLDVRKNVSGYFNGEPLDAIDLFVGSEGTLGVISQIELSVLPAPEGFFSGIVFFNDEASLLDLVSEARRRSFATRANALADIDATLLEYFDANSIRFIAERFPETPADAAGAVFFEQETTAENEDELLEKWNELLERTGADIDRSWFTTTAADRERLRSFRHALPVAVNERVVRNKQKKIGTDMAVPDDRFAAFLKFYRTTLDKSGLEYVIFGHIGDNHLHANMLPKDDAEAVTARHIYGRCIAQAIMAGGTISAEHGIGKLKRGYLNVMMGERFLNEMAEVKRAFDANGILGRGNMFDEQLIGDSK